MGKGLHIHALDNVTVALEAAPAGTVLDGVTAVQDIPAGHKMASRDIAKGEYIIKYGNPIGRATQDIRAGEWVHTHNLHTALGGAHEYTYTPDFTGAPQPAKDERTFDGYLRADGRVGIRNELWIVPTVGCVNRLCERLAHMAQKRYAGKIDGAYAWVHPYGCSQLGDDHKQTQRLLAALCHHPNAGGVLIVGLGCENNTMEQFLNVLGPVDESRVKAIIAQDVDDEVAGALERMDAIVEQMQHDVRTPQGLDKLVLGLKCGGSDGFSGLTGNPLVGAVSDFLIARGGSTVLSEVPEMFGAEHLLMQRAQSPEVFERLVHLINDFKDYYERNGQVVYENPSPGNKEGGITTLEEKSLGCTQKGGLAPVVDVIGYGERIRKTGFTLVNGPGNDIVCCTVLAAAGAQMVLFTTGRGNP
nr:altronate dehydratase family protein [bacterium]